MTSPILQKILIISILFRIKTIVHLSCFLLILFTFNVAHGKLSENELINLRQKFNTIEKSLHKGNNTPFYKTKSILKKYPLFPHLEGLALRNRIFLISQKDVDLFIRSHGKSLPSDQLQTSWLNFLISHNLWKKYLIAYQKSSIKNTRYNCYLGRAYLKTNQLPLAWKQSKDLWLVADSQHSACNPLFSAWKKSGEMTQTLIEKRFWLAVSKNNITLARYISQSINDKNKKSIIQTFWKVRKNPWLLSKKNTIKSLSNKLDIAATNSIKNLIRYNTKDGTQLWLHLRQKLPLSSEKKDTLDSWLAFRLAKSIKTDHTKTILELDHNYRFPKVTKWRIKYALSKKNWPLVRSLIKKLPPEEIQKNQWQYWQAVAIAAYNPKLQQRMPIVTPTKALSKESNTLLKNLSQERGFYGFIAALIKDTSINLNIEHKPLNKKIATKLITQYPHLPRIREWIAHNRHYEAQRELNRLRPQLNKESRALVAYLAKEWNWHFQAITTAAEESLWDHLYLRFPKPLENHFKKSAKQNHLNPSWPIAIARQESAFHPKAYSSKGALGFMQLMPSTAKSTAQSNNIQLKHLKALHDPNINIFLGTAYLAELQKRFKNKVYATAAYNAGPTRVSRWIQKRGHLPLDIWIETIPFKETRQYVKNVLVYRTIYDRLENHTTAILPPKEAKMLTLARFSLLPSETKISLAPKKPLSHP